MRDGWMGYSFITSSGSLAAVSWIGLIVTVAGFAVAIYQLAKIKTASEASAEAGKQVISLVKERMNLTELISAAGYVDNLRTYIGSGRYEGATIVIELLRTKLIFLRETLPLDDGSPDIGAFLVDLSLISDQLRNPPTARADIRQLVGALVPVSDMLQSQIARLRFTSENLLTRE
jgi:hypothetical protein